MATVLDLGLLEEFSIIFSMLLVFILVYAILQYTKILGENKAIHAFIAILIAIIILFVPSIGELLTTIIPWYVVLFIFILMMLISYKMFGIGDEDLADTLKNYTQIIYWIIILSVIILLGGLGKLRPKSGRN